MNQSFSIITYISYISRLNILYSMMEILKRTITNLLINLRFNLSANFSSLFGLFYKFFYKPKKGSINDFLNEYSRSKKNHLNVIQIGANDGITHDPIHKFIKRDNWAGVLLEPQPQVYRKFLSKIYKQNKKIHTLCAALGYKNGHMPIYKIGFSNMRWATGLASFNEKQVEKAFTSGQVQRQCNKYGIKIPKSHEEQISSEDVEVISTNSLLQKYNIKRIDLLQIDTEGFDCEIVQMFDIPNTNPHVIVFENSHISTEDHVDCIQLLSENDYSIQNFGANTLAMKKPLGKFERFFHL